MPLGSDSCEPEKEKGGKPHMSFWYFMIHYFFGYDTWT
jgi:hypothetical protein